MSKEKREARRLYKEQLNSMYDEWFATPYPSERYDELERQIKEGEKKLKELSREATLEWLKYGD